ncbi:hypothetical protein C8J55DRAFT_443015, partial [Lentinula edodes]
MFPQFSSTFVLALVASVNAAPTLLSKPAHRSTDFFSIHRRAASVEVQKQNGLMAQAQNAAFAAMTENSTCTTGQDACVNGAFAQCTGSTFSLTPCSAGLSCFALPLLNSNGTSISCDTEADVEARIQAAGVEGGIFGNSTTTTSTA